MRRAYNVNRGYTANGLDVQYDLAGNRTRLSWPANAGSVNYDYDTAGELVAIRETGQTSAPGALAIRSR